MGWCIHVGPFAGPWSGQGATSCVEPQWWLSIPKQSTGRKQPQGPDTLPFLDCHFFQELLKTTRSTMKYNEISNWFFLPKCRWAEIHLFSWTYILQTSQQNGNCQGNKQISLTPNRQADFGNVLYSHWHSTRRNFTALWQKVEAGTRLYLYSFRMESWHLYTIPPSLKPKAKPSCANLRPLPLLTIPYNFGLSLQVNLVI